MTVRFGTGNQAILSSAVGTLHFSGSQNIEKDSGVVIPGRSIFSGAMERKIIAMNHDCIHFV